MSFTTDEPNVKKSMVIARKNCTVPLFVFVIRSLIIKQFLLVSAFFTSIANLAIILFLHKSVPLLQSYILEPISILGIIFLTYYNHTRARKSSSALLIYWPIYTITVLIWVRTAVARDFNLFRLPVALKCAACVLGFLSFALECIGPEFDQKSDLHESPILTVNIFGNWVSKFYVLAVRPTLRWCSRDRFVRRSPG